MIDLGMKKLPFLFAALALACQTEQGRDLAMPEIVAVHFNGDGSILWNGERVTLEEVDRRFVQAAAANLQPPFKFDADRDAKYADMAAVLAAAQRAGLETKIGIIGGT